MAMAKQQIGQESEAGRVVAARGQVAEVEFPQANQPEIHDLLILPDDKSVRLEVVMSKSPRIFYCLVLRGHEKLQRDMSVVNTHEQLMIPVGLSVLGRAFDIFAEVHDGGKPLPKSEVRSLFDTAKQAENVDTAVSSQQEVMETGIKVIDFFTPLLLGGKAALVGGAGIGKTVILMELVNRMVIQKQRANALAVFSGVGERSREAEELYSNFKKAQVLPYTTLILAQMGENPAVRFRTAYAGATLAEYFRDAHKSDVLFFMDNTYRFAQAGHELSIMMNAIPSEDGYQPTLASEIAELQERLVSTERGTITSFMALFVPSDDLTDSAVRSILPYLDTMIVLSRDIFQSGRFPAVDLLTSTSAAISPMIVGLNHYNAYVEAKQILEEAAGLERIVSLVGEDELSPEKRLMYIRAQLIINYMTQSLFVIEEETGQQASYVPLTETIEVIKDILDGKYDAVESGKFRFLDKVSDLARQAPVSKRAQARVPATRG